MNFGWLSRFWYDTEGVRRYTDVRIVVNHQAFWVDLLRRKEFETELLHPLLHVLARVIVETSLKEFTTDVSVYSREPHLVDPLVINAHEYRRELGSKTTPLAVVIQGDIVDGIPNVGSNLTLFSKDGRFRNQLVPSVLQILKEVLFILYGNSIEAPQKLDGDSSYPSILSRVQPGPSQFHRKFSRGSSPPAKPN